MYVYAIYSGAEGEELAKQGSTQAIARVDAIKDAALGCRITSSRKMTQRSKNQMKRLIFVNKMYDIERKRREKREKEKKANEKKAKKKKEKEKRNVNSNDKRGKDN